MTAIQVNVVGIKSLLSALKKAKSIKSNEVAKRLEKILIEHLDAILNHLKETDAIDILFLAETDASLQAVAPAAGISATRTIIRPPLRQPESPENKMEGETLKPRQQAPKKESTRVKPVEQPISEGKVAKKDEQEHQINTVDDAANFIISRYNKKPDKFKNWNNSLQITLPDMNRAFVFKINGSEGIELSEEANEDAAAVQVEMTSDIFIKLISKQMNPIKAYSSGTIKVKGQMKNMLKLKNLMF